MKKYRGVEINLTRDNPRIIEAQMEDEVVEPEEPEIPTEPEEPNPEPTEPGDPEKPTEPEEPEEPTEPEMPEEPRPQNPSNNIGKNNYPICPFGDNPYDDIDLNIVDPEECTGKELIMLQLYTPYEKRLLTFVVDLLAEEIVEYPLSKGSARIRIGYSKRDGAVVLKVISATTNEPIYFVSMAMIYAKGSYSKLEHYDKFSDVIGKASLTYKLEPSRRDFITSISWVSKDFTVDLNKATWIAGKDTTVFMPDNLEIQKGMNDCNRDSDFDDTIDEGRVNDLTIKEISFHEAEMCVYIPFEEIQEVEGEETTNAWMQNDPDNIKTHLFTIESSVGIDKYSYEVRGSSIAAGNFKDSGELNGAKKQEISIEMKPQNYLPGDEIWITIKAKDKRSSDSEIVIYEKRILIKNCIYYEGWIKEAEDSEFKSGGKVCERYMPNEKMIKVNLYSSAGISSYKVYNQDGTLLEEQDLSGKKRVTNKDVFLTVPPGKIMQYKFRVEMVTRVGEEMQEIFTANIIDCPEPNPGSPTLPEGIPEIETVSICEGGKISAGGYGAYIVNFTIPEGTFPVNFYMDAFSAEDSFDAYYRGKHILSSNGFFTNKKEFHTKVESNGGEVIKVAVFGSTRSSRWVMDYDCEEYSGSLSKEPIYPENPNGENSGGNSKPPESGPEPEKPTIWIKENSPLTEMRSGSVVCKHLMHLDKKMAIMVGSDEGIKEYYIYDENGNEYENLAYKTANMAGIIIPKDKVKRYEFTVEAISMNGNRTTRIFTAEVVECSESNYKPEASSPPTKNVYHLGRQLAIGGKGIGFSAVPNYSGYIGDVVVPEGEVEVSFKEDTLMRDVAFDAYYKGEHILTTNGYVNGYIELSVKVRSDGGDMIRFVYYSKSTNTMRLTVRGTLIEGSGKYKPEALPPEYSNSQEPPFPHELHDFDYY